MNSFFRKKRVLQPLRLSAVYNAARHLMLTNKFTTVDEVEDYLIERNFKVYNNEVQSIMNRLAIEEDWYRSPKNDYQFKKDTNESLETILQKGKRKIKVKVHGRKFFIFYLREKKEELKEHISNREAMYDAEKWLSKKLNEGYYCAT